MVNIDGIENKLLELESFFEKVINSSPGFDDSSYGAGASYGLKSVRNMKDILTKYKKKPQNKLLKYLYTGFTAVTRGVEGFNNHDLNEKFNKTCDGIYEISQEINAHIKW
jgi:hypothetical protein